MNEFYHEKKLCIRKEIVLLFQFQLEHDIHSYDGMIQQKDEIR